MDCFLNEVLFKAHFNAGHGEELKLCGSFAGLGFMKPEDGINMFTTSDDYPVWTSEVTNIKTNPDEMRYNYAIFSGGRFARWEKCELRSVGKNVNCVKGVCIVEDIVDITSHEDYTSPPLIKIYLQNQVNFKAANCTIDSSDSVLVVSYFLPIKLSKSEDGSWVVTRDQDHFVSFNVPNAQVNYIGTVLYQGRCIPPEDRVAVANLLRETSYCPVFFDEELHHMAHNLFCKETLWRVLQEQTNVFCPVDELLSQSLSPLSAQMWTAYNTVLRRFRVAILELYFEGALIWIHGYELMILPSIVRRKISAAKIGLFFHSPFHQYDQWSHMFRREDMLRGMLGANQIGFHSYETTKNFASACCRLLGYVYYFDAFGRLVLNVDDNEVILTSIHKGVDLPYIYSLIRKDEFLSLRDAWKVKFDQKTIFGCYVNLDDQLKHTSVIFTEFYDFVCDNPEWAHKLVFTVVAVRPAYQTRVVKQNRIELSAWTRLINGKFGREMIYFEERGDEDMGIIERLSYFAAVDVILVINSPFGFLQYSMEFVLAKQRALLYRLGERETETIETRQCGALLLCLYRSLSRTLGGAVYVDTRKSQQVSRAIKYALEAPPADVLKRMMTNLSYVVNHTASTWAYYVLNDLKSAVQKVGRPNLVNATALGSQSFLKDVMGRFKALDTEELYASYRATHCRLFLCNCESLGVLGEKEKAVLETLCVDKKNIVFLVSSKSVYSIDEYLNNFKYLGLGAEHGYFFKWPAHKLSTIDLQLAQKAHAFNRWQCALSSKISREWQGTVRPILEIFTHNTDGAYIDEYMHSLLWQYGNADPEFGYAQSKQLEDFLLSTTGKMDVDIIRSHTKEDRFIEIRTKGVDKAAFLESLVLTLESVHMHVDFIFSVGDDDSDEAMFRAANAIDLPIVVNNKKPNFSTVIGRRQTIANVCVDSVTELMNILKKLARNASSEKKFYSTSDLQQLRKDRRAKEHSHHRTTTGLAKYRRSDDGAVNVDQSNTSSSEQSPSSVLSKLHVVRSSPSIHMAESHKRQQNERKGMSPTLLNSAQDDIVGTASRSVLKVFPILQHSESFGDYLNKMETCSDQGDEEPPSF